jgi:hypothetical protein
MVLAAAWFYVCFLFIKNLISEMLKFAALETTTGSDIFSWALKYSGHTLTHTKIGLGFAAVIAVSIILRIIDRKLSSPLN